MFRGNFFLYLALILFLGQIVSWRLFLRRSRSPRYRFLVHFLFILFNVFWFIAYYAISAKNGLSGDLWSLVGRPGISWQFIHLLIVLPLSALAFAAYGIVLGARRLAKRARRLQGALPAREDAAEGAATVGAAVTEEKKGPFRDRRHFIRDLGSAGLLGVMAVSAYGVVRQSLAPQVRRRSLRLPGLPRELSGFSIAHLTDNHLGLWSNAREMSLAVETAAREKPDLVLFTGDLVDRSPDNALYYGPALERYLSRVPYGVYGVLGNHDHYANPDRITQILRRDGLWILRDERVNIQGIPLSLTGLDDQGVHMSWARRRAVVDEEGLDILSFDLIQGLAPRAGDFRILLNHRPEGWRQAASEGYRVYLAGHTHGGQYALPGFPQVNLATMVYKYTSGLYESGGNYLNVSCGLAAVGVPFRFGAFPEISLLTLERA
ncbi:MAG: metallophosphoesterase [Deltaproteobacteria bacterium]|nr:metallophosphoesterase [Deltaproteobacteria bacterium]